jgi:hypothetical protein
MIKFCNIVYNILNIENLLYSYNAYRITDIFFSTKNLQFDLQIKVIIRSKTFHFLIRNYLYFWNLVNKYYRGKLKTLTNKKISPLGVLVSDNMLKEKDD